MADDPNEMAGTERARALLAHSETVVDDMLHVLKSMAERVRNNAATDAELDKALTVFSRMRGKLLEEVVKYENGVLYAQKQVAHAPLDFDKLRDEIGCKLARVLAEEDPDEVS